jgi:hypothetical protein
VPLGFWSPDVASAGGPRRGGPRRGVGVVWQRNVGGRRGGGGCADSVSGTRDGNGSGRPITRPLTKRLRVEIHTRTRG